MYVARFALFILCMIVGLPCLSYADDPVVGTVTRVKGVAMVDDERASTGDMVFSGSSLSTDENGRLEVTFVDKTKLQVGGDSTFVVDDYSFAEGKKRTLGKAFFRLIKGSFRMVTSEIVGANPDAFGVRTPLASIGIRGTDFWGGYLSPVEIDIVMLEGKGVIVTSMGGVVEIDEPGVGVSIPDPTRHPKGFSKALQPPEKTRWSPEKLAIATETVSFN